MRGRAFPVCAIGIWVSGMAYGIIEPRIPRPTPLDIAPSVLPTRPAMPKKNASDTLLAGRRPFKPSSLAPQTRLPVESLDVGGWWSEMSRASAVAVPLPRLRPPDFFALDDLAVERVVTSESLRGAFSFSGGKSCASFAGSAMEYLLLDRSLNDSQRTIVPGVLERYQARRREWNRQVEQTLAWVERVAPDGRMTAEIAERVLATLHAHLLQRERIESDAVDELRRVLTDAQWNRLRGWMERRPWKGLGASDTWEAPAD